MKVLKREYAELQDDFSAYTNEGCSCHINPPCGYCTHEGNPDNLAENEDAWEELVCKWCGTPTDNDCTKLCDICCEVEKAVITAPDTAKQILAALEKRPMTTVAVRYTASTIDYTFMTDEDFKPGDKAVVFTNGNWNVVTITEVHKKPMLHGSYNYTWIVQKVDRTRYDQHIKRDHEGYPKVEGRL